MVFWGFLEMLDLTTLKPGPYSIAWHTVISVLAFLCRLRFAAFVNNRLDPAGSGSLLWMRGFSVGTCCFAAVGTSCCLLACVYVSSPCCCRLGRQSVFMFSSAITWFPFILHNPLLSVYWSLSSNKHSFAGQLQHTDTVFCVYNIFSFFSLLRCLYGTFICTDTTWGGGRTGLCVPSWAILLLAPTSCLSSWDWSHYAASGRRMVLSCTLQFLVTAVTGIVG